MAIAPMMKHAIRVDAAVAVMRFFRTSSCMRLCSLWACGKQVILKYIEVNIQVKKLMSISISKQHPLTKMFLPKTICGRQCPLTLMYLGVGWDEALSAALTRCGLVLTNCCVMNCQRLIISQQSDRQRSSNVNYWSLSAR